MSLDGCRGIKASDTFSLLDNGKSKLVLKKQHAILTHIIILTAFPELVQLSLASTEIGAQTTVPRRSLQHLQVLDAGRTGLDDDDMTKIVASFSELRELKLGGCMHITTRGLAALARGKSSRKCNGLGVTCSYIALHLDLKCLEMIQFPNREEELDGVLARYAGTTPMSHT